MRSIHLSPSHYAARWPADQIYTPAHLTELGCRMAALAEGAAKEEKLLEIVRCFHGYLTKYMAMILHGHVSHERLRDTNGPGSFGINKDTRALLRILLPRGQKENKASLAQVCRTLHLAFRQMGPDEVFDVLMMCLLKSVRRYDPFFHTKIRFAAEAIDGPTLAPRRRFGARELNAQCPGEDTARSLRYLAKRGFLTSSKQESGELRYERSASWPPPAAFFAGGPIGLSYFATQWFRYHLLEFIDHRMAEVEAKQGFCQLRYATNTPTISGEDSHAVDRGLPTTLGNLVNAHTGRLTAADLQMVNLPVDVGALDLDWVHSTKQGLFAGLTKEERLLLYYVFGREMDFEAIATAFGRPAREVKLQYQQVLARLRQKAGIDAAGQAA